MTVKSKWSSIYKFVKSKLLNLTAIEMLGVIGVIMGIVLHLTIAPKYLNYETGRKLNRIDQKLDLIFLEIASLNLSEKSKIEEFESLKESKEKEATVAEVAHIYGYFVT